jgi:hypothetical protein
LEELDLAGLPTISRKALRQGEPMAKPKPQKKPKKPAKTTKAAKPDVNTIELVSAGFPLGPRPKAMREWSVEEFKAWRRAARQAGASELVQVVSAAGQIPGVAQCRPLPPAKPHRGGRPGTPAVTDEALQAARDARTTAGRPLAVKQQQEIAQGLGVHLRTIQRRLKRLPS